jgi:hypothetical protein
MDRRKFIVCGANGIAGISVLSTGFSNVINLAVDNGKMMEAQILETPKFMNMGFHYTQQYSRRTRVNVMGLVDQTTEEWKRWYHKTHKLEAVKEMADTGYRMIEIHFMYGFGIEGEKSEYELTKLMVENAHKAGLKVFGYFQFFSVMKELFFIENPWAKECLQLKTDGTPHLYRYDRPALCFTHKKVQDYYLNGIEVGLNYCNLDGIRLDNDYFKGCFCENCQREFKEYLNINFPAEKARRVFGFEQLNELNLYPFDSTENVSIRDPLFLESVKFRMLQRQKMMNLLHDKIVSVKPEAIFGGNPAICRGLNDCSRINVYIPDLGKTHHLVCAENDLFPGRTGNSVRHQIVAYKHGQANDFKVFPSHHLHNPGGKGIRWPETKEECALSICESLAFGGHVPCTSWGIRMDGTEDKTLYKRAYFLEALTPIKNFLEENEYIYRKTESAAEVGIYINRETQIADSHAYWHSLHGIIQLLIRDKIPFRFVDTDDDKKLEGLKILLIGNVRLVSNIQLERFITFAKANKIIITGESCMFDEYFLRRNPVTLNNFLREKNIIHLKNCPERILPDEVEYYGRNYHFFPLPPDGDNFIRVLKAVYNYPIKISSSPFVAIDISKNDKNEIFIHILNYDNTSPHDVDIEFEKKLKTRIVSPEVIGCEEWKPDNEKGRNAIKLKNLHTYAVLCITT